MRPKNKEPLKNEKINILTTYNEKEEFYKIAKQQGISVSEAGRKAIAMFSNRYKSINT